MNTRWNWMTALLALFLAPLTQSCVSQTGLRQIINDREMEIRDLREERATLKSQLQSLHSDLETTTAELNSKSSMLDDLSSVTPEPASFGEPTRTFPELDRHGIDVDYRDGQMVISIPSSISFRSGQASLSKAGRKALLDVAATLKQEHPSGMYYFEGHTDSDPIRKSKFDSNRTLSISRAMAVLTYLVEEGGIPDEQCTVVGHGQYRPIAGNDSQSGKARNRRVEIVVHSG